MSEAFSAVLYDLLKSRYDKKQTKSEEYAEQLYAVHEEFVNRNRCLTELLNDYISERAKRIVANRWYKLIVYIVFILLFVVFTITVISVFTRTDFNRVDIDSVVALASVAVTYLTSILSIVQIMSKYLFPLSEEKDAIEMIKTVLKNDVEVEKMMSSAIEKTRGIDFKALRECRALRDDGIITTEEFKKIKENILNFKVN